MHFLQVTSDQPRELWNAAPAARVALVANPPPNPSPVKGAHRSSPLFPLDTQRGVVDLSRGEWDLHFLVPDSAFTLLARISNGTWPSLKEHTWFGIGIASVVLLHPAGSLPEGFLEEVERELMGYENWQVKAGSLNARGKPRLPTPVADVPEFIPPNFLARLPSDQAAQIQEFDESWAAAVRATSLYFPDELPVLSKISKDIQLQVAELGYLANVSPEMPTALRLHDLSSEATRGQLVQQCVDRIVQTNSVLSYVISQSLLGAPPISAGSSLIKRHALLGIGRAYAALRNLVRQIEEAFNGWSIPHSIFNKWSKDSALPGLGRWELCLSEKWSECNLPDKLLESTPNERAHKLVYFSGRFGFKEAEYAVSSAIQTLTAGDSSDWPISTITHEVLHGHVRHVIAAIFDPRPDGSDTLDHSWDDIFEKFSHQMRSGSADGLTFLDSARHVILSYCCLARTHGSLTEEPEVDATVGRIGREVPSTSEKLRSALRDEDRNLSEIMVHVLDMFYFYHDQTDHYLKSIWLSWKNVPQVAANIREYVLRSLLAAASTSLESDKVIRFSAARRHCEQVLKELSSSQPADPVLKDAIDVLALDAGEGDSGSLTAESHHPLFLPFYCSLRIVDFARHCLASETIRDALFKDATMSTEEDDNTFSYDVDRGEFVDRRIENVSSFVAWRRRSEEGTAVGSEIERYTAWLFIACGDIRAKDGNGFDSSTKGVR